MTHQILYQPDLGVFASTRDNKILGTINHDGYVILQIENTPTRAHRLAVERSGVEIPEGFVVHHKNGSRSDNRLSNLQVIEHYENVKMRIGSNMPSPFSFESLKNSCEVYEFRGGLYLLKRDTGKMFEFEQYEKPEKQKAYVEGQPFTVRGQTFQTVSECAKAFGLSYCTVREAVNRGRFETIGVGRRKKRKVFWKGTTYNVEDISKISGVKVKSIYNAIQRGGNVMGSQVSWYDGQETTAAIKITQTKSLEL